MPAAASVVIPLLRQIDAWLEQAVRSALQQTAGCEVIVVTSPKTVESNRQVLRRISTEGPGLRVIEQEPQTGFAAAMNLGIRAATATRVGFLLSDDWLDPRAVEQCLRHDADLVSTSFLPYAEDGRQILKEIAATRTEASYLRLRSLSDKANFLGHFLLFRRSTLEATGGLDESLGDSPGVDDFDLIWCLLERGATVAIVPEALYNYRDHEGERLTRRSIEEMNRTFQRILDKHHVTGEERERLIRNHSRWFGRSMWSVYQEYSMPVTRGPLRPLRSVYRSLVPMNIRYAIDDRCRAILRRGNQDDPE